MKHPVYDTDLHFTIDPTTRALIAQMKKLTLVQGAHNSERFTFDFPRMVEGHDLSLCDLVEVHFLNIDAVTKETSPGTYGVDDVQVCEEDDQKITFSWLIDGRATKFGGTLSFSIHFKCMGDGKLLYRWPTAIFSGILISDGIDHGEAVMEDYTDIVAAWMSGIEQSIDATVSEAVNKAVEENVSDAVDKAVDATVGDAVDKAIEDAINNSGALKIDTANLSNAITGYASGSELLLNDISPIASKVKVNVVGKQPPEVPMMMSMMRSASPASDGLVNLVPFVREDGELGYADCKVGESVTKGGLTYKVNTDGSVTVSGVSNGISSLFNLYKSKTSIPSAFELGETYSKIVYTGIQFYAREFDSSGGEGSFLHSKNKSGKLSTDSVGLGIHIAALEGTDVTGITVYPMIVEGSMELTEADYVPPQGATADGGDHTCIDANKDHKCDICGKQLSACYDNDGDHKCDYCGATLTDHIDDDGNGYCDTCGEITHTHTDADSNHVCDICGEVVSECEDANFDHLCDHCGEYLGAHRDADGDGLCDYCGQAIDEVVTPLSVKVQTASVDDPETIVETVVTVAGAIVELTPIFPAMIIKTDSEEVLLSAEYNKDTNAVIAELRDAIGEGGEGGDGCDGGTGIYDLVITSDEEFSKCLYAMDVGSANTGFKHKTILVKDVTFTIQRGSSDLDLHIFQPSIKYIKFENCRWETQWWVSGKHPLFYAQGGQQYERAPGDFDLVIEGIDISADNVQSAKDAGEYWYIGLRNIKALLNSTVRYPEGYDIGNGWDFKLTCQYFDHASGNHVPALWDGANVSDCYITEKLVRCTNCVNIKAAPVLKDGELNPITFQDCACISNYFGTFSFIGCSSIGATRETVTAMENSILDSIKDLYVPRINRSDNYAGLFLYGVDNKGVQKHYHARTSPGAGEVPVTNAKGTLQTTWEDWDKFDNYNNSEKWPKSALMPRDYIDRAINNKVAALSERIAALESKIT